ncbi:hypothetical protein YW3DRAFT_07320 [Streptomyces sp. MnatMP-M77]|nr:hypothetical protein YW3DRAFT_07320 [Streptomyces sp. MnatMP-M77]
MQRAGLTEEGYIREHIQRGSQWHDSIQSILDHDCTVTCRRMTLPLPDVAPNR